MTSILTERADLAAAMQQDRRSGAIEVLSVVTHDVFELAAHEITRRGGRLDDLRDYNLRTRLTGSEIEDWADAVLTFLDGMSPDAAPHALLYSLMHAYAQWGVGATQQAAQGWLYDQPGFHHAL